MQLSREICKLFVVILRKITSLHQSAGFAYLSQSASWMQTHLRENRTGALHARNIKIGPGNNQKKDEKIFRGYASPSLCLH